MKAAQSNWERTGTILKQTFQMAGAHHILYLPPILQIITWVLGILLAILAFVLPGGIIISALILLLTALVSAYLSAALSWMVYQVHKGKKPDFTQGFARGVRKSWSLLGAIGIGILVGILTSFIRGDRSNQGLIQMILRSVLASAIEEAWDIASHFLMPAIVLTDQHLGGALKELPQLTKHLPQALVGGFAFDIIVRWMFFLEFLLALLILFATGMVWPALILFVVLVFVTWVFYSFTKSVYFTMLYLDMHPELKKK